MSPVCHQSLHFYQLGDHGEKKLQPDDDAGDDRHYSRNGIKLSFNFVFFFTTTE